MSHSQIELSGEPNRRSGRVQSYSGVANTASVNVPRQQSISSNGIECHCNIT